MPSKSKLERTDSCFGVGLSSDGVSLAILCARSKRSALARLSTSSRRWGATILGLDGMPAAVARCGSNRRDHDSAPLLWNVDGLLLRFGEFLITLAYQVKNEVNLRLTRETLERLSLHQVLQAVPQVRSSFLGDFAPGR